jgi:hypothetical protein
MVAGLSSFSNAFILHPSAFILIFSGIPPRAGAIKGLSGPVRVVSLPQFLESKP